jgi:hypothetical protein
VIENALYQALSQSAAVTDLLSDSTAVFYKMMPKDTVLPAIVYQSVGKNSVHSFDGENELQMKRFQFDAYAVDPFVSRQLLNAIHDLLVPSSSGPQPAFPFTLPDGTEIQSSVVHNDMDAGFEPGEPGPYGEVFRTLLDVELAYIES